MKRERVVSVVIGVGALLRLIKLLGRRSLWLDEAMLALNVASRPFRQLHRPLDYEQFAPVPFLWGQRAAGILGGFDEVSLRVIPLLAGITFLIVIWRLARRLLDDAPALLAVGIAALSPILVRYSIEAKQYGLDALVAAAILILAFDRLDDPGPPGPRRALLLSGAVAVLVSPPAIFVLAGVVVALLAAPSLRQGGGARWVVVASASWGVVFALSYRFLYGGAGGDAYLRRFWSPTFLSPRNPDALAAAGKAGHGLLASVFFGRPENVPFWISGVAAGLALAGLGSIRRRNGAPAVLLLTVPIVLAAAASVLERYPLAPRLLLFAAPALILLLAGGISWLTGRLRRGRRPALALASVLFLFPAAQSAPGPGLYNLSRDDTRRAVETFGRLHRPGENVYLFASGVPAWVFYTTDWRSPDRARLAWYVQATSKAGTPGFHNSPSRSRPVSPDEGNGLFYDCPDRREIVGLPDGMEVRFGLPPSRPVPDPGWREEETNRIRAAADPNIWLFFAQFRQSEVDDLLRALQASGAEVLFRDVEEGARLYEVRFPSSGTATGARGDSVRRLGQPGEARDGRRSPGDE